MASAKWRPFCLGPIVLNEERKNAQKPLDT